MPSFKASYKSAKISAIINTLKAKKAFEGGDASAAIAATTNALKDMLDIAIDHNIKNANK